MSLSFFQAPLYSFPRHCLELPALTEGHPLHNDSHDRISPRIQVCPWICLILAVNPTEQPCFCLPKSRRFQNVKALILLHCCPYPKDAAERELLDSVCSFCFPHHFYLPYSQTLEIPACVSREDKCQEPSPCSWGF